MGHIRLGTLPRSKKWREVVDLIATDASVEEIAEAATDASDKDLSRASRDPRFRFVSDLLVRLPLLARAPGCKDALADFGITGRETAWESASANDPKADVNQKNSEDGFEPQRRRHLPA